MHEVLVNRLGGLSLPRKSVARLTDRPDMTLDVYRGRKTTIQQQEVSMIFHYVAQLSFNGCQAGFVDRPSIDIYQRLLQCWLADCSQISYQLQCIGERKLVQMASTFLKRTRLQSCWADCNQIFIWSIQKVGLGNKWFQLITVRQKCKKPVSYIFCFRLC